MISSIANATGVRNFRQGATLRRAAWHVWSDPMLLLGLVIVVSALFLMVFGNAIVPYSPITADAKSYLLPPSTAHWLGTDSSGMDVLSRCLVAPRTDLIIAMSATGISLALGSVLGVGAGYLRGWLGELTLRISDIIVAFPAFILAMAIVAVAGPKVTNVILVLAVVNTPIYVRLMFSETLSLGRRQFVEAARAVGNGDIRIILRHVLPNAITSAFVQASVTVGFTVLLTAGLSFVGAGVQAPTPEWGLMVSTGAPYIITGEWWPSVFPGVFLAVTVLGFALIGDRLRRVYYREV